MPQTIWHCFSGQLLMLFQMVCFVLLTVLHPKTLLLIGCEISTANRNPTNKCFFNGNTESKTKHTIWKSIEIWAENWCEIACGILFDLFTPWQVVRVFLKRPYLWVETSWRLQLDRPAIVSTLGLEPTRWKTQPKLPRVFPNTGGPHPVGNMPETEKDIAILMARFLRREQNYFQELAWCWHLLDNS